MVCLPICLGRNSNQSCRCIIVWLFMTKQFNFIFKGALGMLYNFRVVSLLRVFWKHRHVTVFIWSGPHKGGLSAILRLEVFPRTGQNLESVWEGEKDLWALGQDPFLNFISCFLFLSSCCSLTANTYSSILPGGAPRLMNEVLRDPKAQAHGIFFMGFQRMDCQVALTRTDLERSLIPSE